LALLGSKRNEVQTRVPVAVFQALAEIVEGGEITVPEENPTLSPTDYLRDREHVVPLTPWTENNDAPGKPPDVWANIAGFFPAQTTSSVRVRWKIPRTQELNGIESMLWTRRNAIGR
jgi:hypothetical protein